jgi:hypothetical protein
VFSPRRSVPNASEGFERKIAEPPKPEDGGVLTSEVSLLAECLLSAREIPAAPPFAAGQACWGAERATELRISRDAADAIADARRPAGMNADEEIVYEFTTELQRNKRISDLTYNRAEQRFGKKGVVDVVAISGYYNFLAMQLNMGRYKPSGRPRFSRFPD